MAEIDFVLSDIDGEKFRVKDIISYEIQTETAAPCDAVRLYFTNETLLSEIVEVEAFCNGVKLFSGFADAQREERTKDGYRVFIYARSSACVLVDNEANPYTYFMPSLATLFEKNAEEFGFVSKLENHCCRFPYRVDKGTSCFGAMNNFVTALTGKSIVVTAENELVIPEGNAIYHIDNRFIISEKRSINRGGIISKIDYKNDGDLHYVRHIKSDFFESSKINNAKKMNLGILPNWQRNYTLINRIKNSARNYNTVEILVDGYVSASLYGKVNYKSSYFENLDGYYISQINRKFDKNGETTLLTLSKNIDLKEIVYVA